MKNQRLQISGVSKRLFLAELFRETWNTREPK